MATHCSVLAWSIPGMGAWWAAVYGVSQSRTRLKRLSSSVMLCLECIMNWYRVSFWGEEIWKQVTQLFTLFVDHL